MDYKIGIVGLGVMGRSLALNLERNGFPVGGYDLEATQAKAFLTGYTRGRKMAAFDSPAALMSALERPRRVLLMVPAGAPVDNAIASLKPHLLPGDILMDGGNSFFMDTERRNKDLETEGFHFLGIGFSGGEQGALRGPSIMPGGQRQAWEAVAPLLRAIAAKAEGGEPCVDYMGPRGAGHYVKMVHNGIEYADMQLIAEVYDLLGRGLGLSANKLHSIFKEWNTGELKSYLIEIAADIFAKTDAETGTPLVDLILDEAQQKGTGKWASQNALDVGAPIPTLNAAVESRILSSMKSQRVSAGKVIHGPQMEFRGDRSQLITAARDALYAAKVVSYAQGFSLLQLASQEYNYNLNPGTIAKIWRAGCIIRADLLNGILDAYRHDPALVNLLMDESFRAAVGSRQASWRLVVQTAVGLGVPVPALGASLAYFDSFRSERLPANLTQAQRDYFGAHTYRRIDREGTFHTEWK